MHFEQHGYAWKHDAEVVKLPNWSSVRRFRAALEQVSASHFGATWEGLRCPEKGEAVAVTVDLGDRPLGFYLHEAGKTLDFTVPLMRSYRPDDCHPTFVLSTLQRRYNLLNFAFETEHGKLAHATILIAYNTFDFDTFMADFASLFPELTGQIASTLEDLKQHEKEEKRKDEERSRVFRETAEMGHRLHKATVKRKPEWMRDELFDEHKLQHGYLLHEPNYESLGVDEQSVAKYLVVRDTVEQKTILVRKLETDREGIKYAYHNARGVFGYARCYDFTVLYGTSWEKIIEAHPEYADGKLTEVYPISSE